MTASVFGLTVMAVWTLVIKFLAPLLWAVAERAAHCAHCAGFCEAACSYDLPVKSLLLKAHKALG